jgi:hypothetical protein
MANKGAFMRTFVASALSMTLLISGAMAADGSGLLAPGKPAGIRAAQQGPSTTAVIIITGIVVAGVAIGLSTSSDGNPGGPVALTTVPTTTIAP